MMRLNILLALLPLVANASQPRKNIILLGVTGSGKSTLGNELFGTNEFTVCESLDSCTSEVKRKEGVLFGDLEQGIGVAISDTGGLGDTEGRDEEFADGVASHVRSVGGAHGIIFVHNACQTRFDRQTRKALAEMVKTLTNKANQGEIGPRLSILLTQCPSRLNQNFYNEALPVLMCGKFNLCNVPMFWFDDYDEASTILDYDEASTIRDYIMSFFSGDSSPSPWRTQMSSWVKNLPSKPVTVPSETERDRLKQELRDQEEEHRKTKERMDQLQDELKHQVSNKDELIKEIHELKESMKNLDIPSGCFAGTSKVIDENLGELSMKDLKIGSRVATGDGWSTVKTFLHFHPSEVVDALEITHDGGTLVITPDHMVFTVGEDGVTHSIPAKDLLSGALLIKNRTHANQVLDVKLTTMQGYYAPITTAGTILVDNVLASCYTQNRHSLPHWVAQIVMTPLRIMPLWLSYMPDSGIIHPYARFLMFLQSTK